MVQNIIIHSVTTGRTVRSKSKTGCQLDITTALSTFHLSHQYCNNRLLQYWVQQREHRKHALHNLLDSSIHVARAWCYPWKSLVGISHYWRVYKYCFVVLRSHWFYCQWILNDYNIIVFQLPVFIKGYCFIFHFHPFCCLFPLHCY